MDDANLTADPATASALSQAELDTITDQLIEKLKTVFDPEIPVDIYELGLIYKVDVSDEKDVAIDMTLTAPGSATASTRLSDFSGRDPFKSSSPFSRAPDGPRRRCT